MDKLNCIENYFVANKAYYLFWRGKHYCEPEWEEYIINKEYIVGAKIGCISNLMLAIKEELVDNKGELVYESRLIADALEKTVMTIASKTSNGYQIGTYTFPDAPTAVAIIRNKIAHGQYTIDFEHGRIILKHKGSDIVISLYKFVFFIMQAFRNKIGYIKTSRYERFVMYLTNKDVSTRTYGLKDLEEVGRAIRAFNGVNFSIESNNGSIIPTICLEWFEVMLNDFKKNPQAVLKDDYLLKMKQLFSKYGCKLTCEYKKIRDKKAIHEILNYVEKQILTDPRLTYNQQLDMIGMEIQKRMDNKYNTFNPLASNIKNLILLSAIEKKNSIDVHDLSSYVMEVIGHEMKFGYDEFGMTLIGMFNSLFVYPFDDIYDVSGGYTPNRGDAFDFGSLDLSMINPEVLNIDDYPLNEAKAVLDRIVKQEIAISNKILEQHNNLSKVKGNSVAEAAINKNITDLKNKLHNLIFDYMKAEKDYNIIANDYTLNKSYFRNKAIIEGIRNSIAHGHYEFITNGDFDDTIIIFSDIYEGNLTFKVSMTFSQFDDLINENTAVLIKYINDRIKSSSGKKLSKK